MTYKFRKQYVKIILNKEGMPIGVTWRFNKKLYVIRMMKIGVVLDSTDKVNIYLQNLPEITKCDF